MKHYHKNPRKISEKQSSDLKKWLEEYGDLSGIVHNIRTDEIIGGNQRAEAMHFMNGTKPTIDRTYKKPTRTGTVAEGHYLYKGEKFNYRQVRWSDKKSEYANMIANKGGGEFDIDIMVNKWGAEILLNTGWKEFELSMAGFQMGGQQDPNKEWEGMPDFSSKDVEGSAVICIIRIVDKKYIKDFEKILGWKLSHKGKTYSTYYPKQDFNQAGKGLRFEHKP